MKIFASWVVSVFALLCMAVVVHAEQQTLPKGSGELANNYVLKNLDGETVTLASLQGKPVIVNFWATWCPPCIKEMPAMNRAWHKIKDDVHMVGINVGEDEDTIFTFTNDYPVDFPLLLDEDGKEVKRWPVRGLPTTFVLDPDGRIVYTVVGGREWDDDALLAKVRALGQ